jgi:hypothetical protein
MCKEILVKMSAILKNVVVLMVEHICMLKLSTTSFSHIFAHLKDFPPSHVRTAKNILDIMF